MSTKKQREQRAKTAAERRRRALQETAATGLKKIIRWPECCAITGKGRTAIAKEITAGMFPAPIPLGGRAVGFLLTEIEEWLAARVAERNQQHQHMEVEAAQ